MSERKKSYCIIKKMILKNGKPQHVILVDSGCEIREWGDKMEAELIAELFNANTDSGYEYFVREI